MSRDTGNLNTVKRGTALRAWLDLVQEGGRLAEANGDLGDRFWNALPDLTRKLLAAGFPTEPARAWRYVSRMRRLAKMAPDGESWPFLAIEAVASRVTARGRCRTSSDALALVAFLVEDDGVQDVDLGPAATRALRSWLRGLQGASAA